VPTISAEDRIKLYWSIAVEEYKAVRDESKQAELNTFTALQWGAVLLSGLSAAGFTQWSHSAFIVEAVFLGFVPLLAIASLYIWIGEVVRMKRAGDYLCLIEDKMAILTRDDTLMPDMPNWSEARKDVEIWLRLRDSQMSLRDPLNWERWLRRTRPPVWALSSSGHQLPTYLARIAFFPAVTLLSLSVGSYYCWYVLPLLPMAPSKAGLAPQLNSGIRYLWLVDLILLVLAGAMAWYQCFRSPVDTQPVRT
jgi:hypothetical protein